MSEHPVPDGQKVIDLFPTNTAFYDFLDMLKKAYDEKRLGDFICIYNYDYEKGDPRSERFVHGIDKYWFSKNTTMGCLGLLTTMTDEILQWMRRKNQEWREEQDE